MNTQDLTDHVRVGRKLIAYAILLHCILAFMQFTLVGPPIFRLAIPVLGVVEIALAVVGIVRVTSGFNYDTERQVLYSILALIPLLGLITLLVFHHRATQYLRNSDASPANDDQTQVHET